jgi:hypothetical protein
VGSDGSTWGRPGTTEEQYQADADACLGFARARIAHDEQIERDIGAARERSEPGLGLNALRGRMGEFERRERLQRLLRDCMETKGYIRR